NRLLESADRPGRKRDRRARPQREFAGTLLLPHHYHRRGRQPLRVSRHQQTRRQKHGYRHAKPLANAASKQRYADIGKAKSCLCKRAAFLPPRSPLPLLNRSVLPITKNASALSPEIRPAVSFAARLQAKRNSHQWPQPKVSGLP